MKGKFNNYLLKLSSLVLAFILVFPTEIFAMAMEDKSSTYNASTSIMGLATQTQNPEENSTESTEEKQTLIKSEISTDETDEYLIEKSATLSKTTGQIDYKILVKSKKSDDKDKNQTAIFAITQNTDLKDLRVERVQELSADGTEKDAEYTQNTASLFTPQDNQRTFGITTTSAENAMVYYLSAKLSDEALADIDIKSPNMDLEFAIKKLENIYQSRYALEIAKPQENYIIIDHNGDLKNQEESLKEITDNIHQYKAIYKEESQGLFANTPAQITWTDYINNKDDKEFTYDIKVDDTQDTSKSEIKIEFYEPTEKGFVIKDQFTKTLAYANSLKLQVPNGHIAKVEFTTSVKENTNPKTFSLNNKEIENPNYKEETDKNTSEETNTDEEDDPLPADSSKEENSQSQKADETQRSKESNKESTASTQSAIALNKDAYISGLKGNNKLTTNLEKATNQIAFVLESYNNDDITWDDFVGSVQNISKAQNLDQAQTEDILSGLTAGLNEDKYKVATIDIAEAVGANSDNEESSEATVEAGAELPADKLSEEEIKSLIKEEFAKKDAGQITEEELEQTLATIREENNIEKEDFFNILSDLYQNEEIANDGEEDTTTINTDQTKEEALAEKLAEENISAENFIAFLKSYAKTYDIEEDDLQAILTENKDEVEKVIGDFTIDEIVAAAYHEGLNPQILAADENANTPSIDFSNEKFMTELEYKSESLSRADNIDTLTEIVRRFDPSSSDQQITDAYVGWRINLPGSDPTGWDLQELKSEKYNFKNLGISLYAPDDQGLRNYYVRITEAGSGRVISSGYMKQNGSHLTYGTDILKAKLPSDGINIDVVAEAPVKRQSYTIGLRVTPDNNYISDLADKFKGKYEELKQKYPLLIKWMDTDQADAFKPGLNLVDTRMVYLEPASLQEKTPYTPYISKEYTDNNTDTDTGIGKNTFTMYGNIYDDENLEWTISETMILEKLYGEEANEIGNSAYSVSGYGNPEVEILVPNGSGYNIESLGQIDQNTLKSRLANAVPGTIVNYTYTKKVDNPGEDQEVTIDHFGSQEVSIRLKEVFDGENDPSLANYDNSKLDQQPNGPGYEVALREPDFMWAFKPLEPSKDPRNQDKGIDLNGVLAYCINMGKKYPTRSNGFNKTMTKVPLTSKDGNKITEKLNNPRLTGTPSTPANVMENIRKVFWYADQMQREYDFDTKTFYRIVQYNIFYYTSTDAEQYAYQFGQDMLPGAMRSYAEELKNRVAAKKGWDQVKEDQVHVYMYEHSDRSKQTVIAGDVHRESEKVGNLEVYKYDEKEGQSKPLYGAIFELKDNSGKLIKRATTDDKGIARFEDIPVGNGYKLYKLIEVKAPAGYTKDSTIRTVNITDTKTTKKAVRENVPNTKPEIKLTKVDEKDIPIDDVSFILRRNGLDVANSTVVSKNGGEFGWHDGLTPGSYEVIEVDLPKGYENYSDNKGKVVYRFKVDANNQIVETSKENLTNENNTSNFIENKKDKPKKGQIEFTKKDSDSGQSLQGAEFILQYKEEDSSNFKELRGSRKSTDSTGKISWKDLEVGDYRVIETKAPGEEYDTDINLGEKATFTVSKTGETYTVSNVTPNDKVITNETKPEEGQGAFEFEKIDEDTNEKLAGVEFTLESVGTVSDSKKDFVYKASKTSDENGKVRFDKLLPGEYKLSETKPLAGYEQNDDYWIVKVTKDDSSNYTTKIYDKDNKDITRNNNSIIDIIQSGVRMGGSKSLYSNVSAELSRTSEDDVFDFRLHITPLANQSPAEFDVYYIYDGNNDEKIKSLLQNSSIANKINLIKGLEINTSNANVVQIPPRASAAEKTRIEKENEANRQFEFSYHLSNIKKKIDKSTSGNTPIVVTLFSNTYDSNDTKEVNLRTGRDNLRNKNIPVFSYFDYTLDPTLKNKVYNINIYYEDGTKGDFSTLIDFINAGGPSKLEKYNIAFLENASDGLSIADGGTINQYGKQAKVVSGLNLVAGKDNIISTKIKINDINALEKDKEIKVLDSIKIQDYNLNVNSDLSLLIPFIKKTRDSSDNTSGQGDSDGANTSSAPAVMASPITNKKKQPDSAKLTIKKVDSETKIGLEGAKFRIYNTKSDAENDNFYLQEVSSNEHGYGVFDSIEIQPNTTYYVKEIAAPDGYKITSEITEVKSSATEDNTINAEIPNEKNNARFELYKKDSDGNSLESVVFKLKNNKTNNEEILTTNSNGYISYDKLDAGTTYELTEIKTLDGYKLNENVATIKVDENGDISVDGGNLLTVEEGKEITLKSETKVTRLGPWKSETKSTNPSKTDHSYMNTLDYVEYNPETKKVTHYIMLKPETDNGGKTDRATTLRLSSTNAKIESVSLYDAGSGNTKASYKTAMQDRNIYLPSREATAQHNNRNLSIKMGGDGSESVRSSMTGLSTTSAYIKFPYDKKKKQGRFDDNWAMLVKVVASVEDAKKASTMSFDWTTDEAGQLSTSSSQTIPALIKEEEIPGRTIKESPTLTAINEKKPEKPSINFVKKDVASGEKLFGAQFVLYKGNEELADTLTSSDKKGKFAFNELEDGSYTVYETSAPDGYPYLEDKENVASFTVDQGKIKELKTNPDFGNTQPTEFNSNKDYIIYNKVNEIKFRKVGENNTQLSGGKFKIRKVSNSDDETNTTVENSEKSANEKGELVWSIKEPGRYQVVETEAPTDYKEVGESGLVVAEFTVAKETLEITNILVGETFYTDTNAEDFPEDGFVNIENKKQGQGSFEITKTDFNSKVLGEAKFLLEDKATGTYIKADGSQANELGKAIETTDASGKINYQNLSNGTYTLREYEAPDGYIKSKNVWEVKVQDSTTTISLATTVEESESVIKGSNLTVKNRGNKITFEKQDKEYPYKKLQDAEFMIYREEDYTSFEGNTSYELYKDANGNTTFKTDEDGKIVLENLKMGHYKIYETKAPDGYYVEDDLADDNNRNMDSLPADEKYVANFYVDINGHIKADEKDEGTTTELTKVIKNTANKAKFRLLKVDNNNKALRSAQFTLTEDGSKGNKGYKYVGTTTSDGAIEFANLKLDKTYTLKETKAPDGYALDKKEWIVSVDASGKVSIEAKNGSSGDSIIAVTDDINNLSDENKERLNANGYLILKATSDKDTTIKVVNKKPTYPSTGGTGVKIAFALIGTAVMITALAYFGMLTSNNNRRRSRRWKLNNN